jgi:hypothetical protein
VLDHEIEVPAEDLVEVPVPAFEGLHGPSQSRPHLGFGQVEDPSDDELHP